MSYYSKRIKFSFVLLTSIILFSSLICKKKYFAIIEATYSVSNSGIPDGGSGKEYYIKMKVLTDKKIVFDSLWINNTSAKTFLANKSKVISNAPVVFTKSDTIVLCVSLLNDYKIKEVINAPQKYKGAALLSFYIEGKIQYYIIKEITQVKTPKRQ